MAEAGAGDDRLERYLDLLLRWNAAYNLTAVRDREAMRVQHLADCLAVVPALRRRLPQGTVLDVGSGGGLPGIVLALAEPPWQVTCVDAVAKKVAFVRQVAAELSLPNVRALHGRVETLRLPPQQVITSRALGSLSDLVRLTSGALAADGCWMAMKGRRPDDEIAALPNSIEVFHVEPLDVPGLSAERCLVWMRPRVAS